MPSCSHSSHASSGYRTFQTTHWADLAVSIDPNLTWIYFEMEGFSGVSSCPNSDLTTPRAIRLQQWDPDNSVPYLMQAERLVDDAKWNHRLLYLGTPCAETRWTFQ